MKKLWSEIISIYKQEWLFLLCLQVGFTIGFILNYNFHIGHTSVFCLFIPISVPPLELFCEKIGINWLFSRLLVLLFYIITAPFNLLKYLFSLPRKIRRDKFTEYQDLD